MRYINLHLLTYLHTRRFSKTCCWQRTVDRCVSWIWQWLLTRLTTMCCCPDLSASSVWVAEHSTGSVPILPAGDFGRRVWWKHVHCYLLENMIRRDGKLDVQLHIHMPSSCCVQVIPVSRLLLLRETDLWSLDTDTCSFQSALYNMQQQLQTTRWHNMFHDSSK